MRLRRNCEEVLKAVPCTVRSGNAVEDDEAKVILSGATCIREYCNLHYFLRS